jgi:hypothetical protein
MRAFRDARAELLEEVTTSWRSGCARLVVTFEDDTEEVKNLTQAFDRVRDDLWRLLPKLLQAEATPEAIELIASDSAAIISAPPATPSSHRGAETRAETRL